MDKAKDSESSEHFPNCFYRVAVKGLCVRDEKLLLCHDFAGNLANTGGAWELPGGGMEFGHNFEETLRKEVREEMGLDVTWMADKPLYVWHMKRKNMRSMDWFYILLLAFPFEVKDLNITPSEECRAIKFFSKEDMLKEPKLSDQTKPILEFFDLKDFEHLKR
ncbi:MAG: NUDIX hydrolase [Candidatus Kaiserbacteria bacterium]|nr:NUDIX hydrolase [Candidatus Kaiserbacteria bacterium]